MANNHTTQQDSTEDTVQSESQLMAQRKAKLDALREEGQAYPNDFKRDALAVTLHAEFDSASKDALEQTQKRVALAGRIMMRRLMGKASFVSIQDMSGRMQLYVKGDHLPEGVYEQFKQWDLGDVVGAEGVLFKTKTGELSVKVDSIRLLVKALRPLPDKFHGLADQEVRYRKRYLDLLVNEDSRRVFEMRSKIISGIRAYLNAHDFTEVETPMMHSLPGGAAARPFVTHHNALNMELYLRIAPELFLKRLVVGGVERVYEINRNFRNEGLSTRHNPEFTMLEFYQAYATYEELMDLTEDMLRTLAQDVLGTTTLQHAGHTHDLSQPFKRLTLMQSILDFNPDITEDDLTDLDKAKVLAKKLEIPLQPHYGLGKILFEVFEKTVEKNIESPTFITQYPTEVSPLARKNDDNPFVTDRFEFFVAGKEIANGFSELNDPEDQAERFKKQATEKAAGNLEAMAFDEDYITALEHGLPPTAGEGIGIDRLVMLFTDSPSIRDVILFPLLRDQ